jgi:hypothetical protein
LSIVQRASFRASVSRALQGHSEGARPSRQGVLGDANASIFDCRRSFADTGDRFERPGREFFRLVVVADCPDHISGWPGMPGIDDAAQILVFAKESVGFVVTNMARPAESVVAFYNKRGTCADTEPPL